MSSEDNKRVVAGFVERCQNQHDLDFAEVELRGLEPLTPCLQNRPRLSDVVAQLGLWPSGHLLGSDFVRSCCGQVWWSSARRTPADDRYARLNRAHR
jgi:hypothetical protein